MLNKICLWRKRTSYTHPVFNCARKKEKTKKMQEHFSLSLLTPLTACFQVEEGEERKNFTTTFNLGENEFAWRKKKAVIRARTTLFARFLFARKKRSYYIRTPPTTQS